MLETWLHPNRRAILFGCVPILVLIGLAGWLAFGLPRLASGWHWAGGAIVIIGVGAMIALLRQLRRPRLAYQDGRVLFYLSNRGPIGVPAGIVEAFFVGQGPATLPGGVAREQQTYNLVARLSQRETDWANRDVKPALGQWCGGYVTIRGAWCEPLEDAVIRRLNRRLKEAKEELVLKVEG